MLLKIPLLIAIVALWIRTENAVLSASIWGGAIFVISLLMHGLSIPVVLGSLLSFVVCFGVLALYEYLGESHLRWAAAAVGAILLLFVV